MEINLLRIFSFEGPEPQATPTPGQADGSLLTGLSAFFQRFNEQVNSWAGITGLSDKVIIAIFLATITIILLLILILILSIFNRNKKKKARRNSRPVSMARPAATKPVSSRPQQAGESAQTAAAANSGFGLQFTLPDGKKGWRGNGNRYGGWRRGFGVALAAWRQRVSRYSPGSPMPGSMTRPVQVVS